ncbi:rubrerythrin family protein [bacterium]|nr:MAG: rubrerythrin family protein [bacterium]
MSKTEDNLKEALAGESQANRTYLAFAKKAEEDGFVQIAKLFRAAAAAETVHAHAHLRVLAGIGSTEDNLREAIGGETHEFTDMYPKMIEEAIAEGNKAAQISFQFANEVEKVHAALYQRGLDMMGDLEDVDYFICEICGNTVEGEAPDKCSVCGAGKKAFFKVD